MNFIRRGALLLAALLPLTLVAPAHADTIIGDGFRHDAVAHYGDWRRGEVLVTEEVELYFNNEFDVIRVRGRGEIEKSYRPPARIQIDYVLLGATAGSGGVVARRTTPAPAGAGSSVAATTPWVTVTSDLAGCQAMKFHVRVGYSVRWADGRLSRFSVLSNATSDYYCRG